MRTMLQDLASFGIKALRNQYQLGHHSSGMTQHASKFVTGVAEHLGAEALIGVASAFGQVVGQFGSTSSHLAMWFLLGTVGSSVMAGAVSIGYFAASNRANGAKAARVAKALRSPWAVLVAAVTTGIAGGFLGYIAARWRR